MTIDLTIEDKKRLNDIITNGKYPSREAAVAAAIRLLQDCVTSDSAPGQGTAAWREKFNRHLASLPLTGAVHVDDSRESIYHGRE